MTLAPGTKLGPYEIVAPIGAGGMGEVYRAKDTRLGRDVALKILPESFAREADRDLAEDPDARTYSMSEVVAEIFGEDTGLGAA